MIVSGQEPIELTITADLLDIPASLMFFSKDASSFRLKVIPPSGFIVTGGTYQDMVGTQLSLRDKPTVTYTLQGYFESTPLNSCFRLLRGGGQADNSSLFVEKANLCIGTKTRDQLARISVPAAVITPLNATTGDCTGITLSASANPTTMNPGGQASLSASCVGCSAGGFNSGQALLFDGIDDENDINGLFQSTISTFTWEAWVRPLQPLTNNLSNERYALYPSYGGSSSSGMGVAVGTNGIRIVEHAANYLAVQLSHDTPISGWNHIAVVYTNNTPALYINGQFVKTGNSSGRTARPSINLGGGPYGHFQGGIDEVRIWSTARSAAQISSAYQQILNSNTADLAAYWRFEETGNTTPSSISGAPQNTTGNLFNGTQRSAGVNSTSASTTYSWQALQGGSALATPNAPTTSVTVPNTPGSYGYRVTLTTGSCISTQDVSIAVANPSGGTGECFVIRNQHSGQYLQPTWDNAVNHVQGASGLTSQIWRFEAADGGLRISSASGSDKVMYVDSYSNDQVIRLGPDATDANSRARYRWIKEPVSGTANYRIRSGNMPWTQQWAGTQPYLQIWGDVNTSPMSQNPSYMQFSFQSVGCPGGSPNTLALSQNSLDNVASSGANQTISVTSNIAWSINGLPSWVTASPTTGTGNGSFALTIQANGDTPRSSSFTVSGGGLTQTLTVRQLGQPAPCTGTGSITYQRWDNIGQGLTIADFNTATNSQQNTPTSTQPLPRFEAPTNVAEAYGARIRGYICPPVTGQYTFWVAGDDHVELWLSTTDNPSGKQKIAYHTGWTEPQSWGNYGTQKSALINLVAGQKYYVEALVKEGTGGDNLAVGWAKPGQSQQNPSEVIPGASLLPYATVPCTAPTLSLGTPVCNGSATYSVSFTVQGGASVTASSGTVVPGSNQVTNVPAGSGVTITASLNGCQTPLSANSPSCGSDPFVDHQVAKKRWWGLNMYGNKQAPNGGLIPLDITMLEASKEAHANFVYATLDWEAFQRYDSSFAHIDYRWMDDLLNRANALNLKVFFVFSFTRAIHANINAKTGQVYIPDSEVQVDNEGRKFALDRRRAASHASVLMNDRFKDIATRVITHIKDSPWANIVMGFSMFNNPGVEANFMGENNPNEEAADPGKEPALYDYSTHSVQQFRQRMRTWYNNDFETMKREMQLPPDVNSFDAISAPVPEKDPNERFSWYWLSPLELKWARHREDQLAETEAAFHTLVKSFSTRLYTMTVYGSAVDKMSTMRGTMSIANKIVSDGLKQNGQVDYPIRRTTQVSLRDYAANKFAGDEIDLMNTNSPLSAHAQQGIDHFSVGGSLLTVANYLIKGQADDDIVKTAQAVARLKDLGNILASQVNLNDPVVRAKGATLTVSSREMYQGNWQDSTPQKIQLFNNLTENNTKLVEVVYLNDL